MNRWTSGAVAAIVLLAALGWVALVAPAPAVPPLAGAVQDHSITVDRRARSFTTYVPARRVLDAGLVLVLHGSSMSGRRMRAATAYGFDELADRAGFVAIYPDGYGGYWNDCRAVGDYVSKRERIDDVAFLRAVVDELIARHDVPADRVFAAGLSNGGQMAFRLAYEAPDLVTAIAAIAASIPAAGNQTCSASGRPVATMIINGVDDPLNPFEGGEVALFRLFVRRGYVQSSLDSARYWARLAGHMGDPQEERMPDTDPADGTSAIRWSWRSDARPDVVLIAVDGGGHTVPHSRGSFPRLLGRTSRDFSAPREIWGFFERARRRE